MFTLLTPFVHRAKIGAVQLADSGQREVPVKGLRTLLVLGALASLAVVSWAVEAFGDAVTGVIAYGSWARGEATSDSDVDVLIVVDPSVALTRDIYRRCDAADLQWEGHPVQFQIVHPPAAVVQTAASGRRLPSMGG